jgi:hypothetical protein
VSYNLRDLDGSIDNAVQPVALQYRVGSTGNFTNLPAGFVADATTGPSLATQVNTAAGFSYAFDCGGGGGYGVFGAANVAACPTSLTGVRSVGGKVSDKDGGINEYKANVAVIVTYDSLCSLTRTRVTKIGIANALCDKLGNAEAAASIGNTGLRDAYLRDYRKQLDSQSGKSVTAANAALLKTLSLALV